MSMFLLHSSLMGSKYSHNRSRLNIALDLAHLGLQLHIEPESPESFLMLLLLMKRIGRELMLN